VQPQMQLAKMPTEQKEMAPAPAAAPKKKAPAALSRERPAPARAGDQLMYEKRFEAEQQRSMGKATAPEREEAAPEAGAAFRDESSRRGLLAPTAVSSKKAAESKANEVHFLVTVEDLDTASKDIEETLRQLGGKAIQTVPLKDKALINAEIDAHKVQELSKELNLIGAVQKKGQTAQVGEGAVGIRIELEKIVQ
jgi:hypothetical protein